MYPFIHISIYPLALVQPNGLLKEQVSQVLSKLAPEFQGNFRICTPRQVAKYADGVNACVIDEADLSLSPACLPPKIKLLEYLRGEMKAKGRRLIYSGATFPLESSEKSIRAQILKYNRDTEVIEEESNVNESVAVQIGNEHFIKFKGDTEDERLQALHNTIKDKILHGKVMIFVRNKLEVGDLSRKLKQNNNSIIVTTDSMSRGIDISDLQHVIHYYPPMSAIDYVHRVGRLNRLNSTIPKEECKSFCLMSEKDLSEGPLYLKLLLNARNRANGTDSNKTNSSDISKFFSRNRSINKQIRRGKFTLPSEIVVPS